jgi:hypothetical protein
MVVIARNPSPLVIARAQPEAISEIATLGYAELAMTKKTVIPVP